MPKPLPSTYPKEQRWRFVQRFVTDKELIEFSKNIVRLHGKKIDDVLSELLGFTNQGKTSLKDAWLDIWVNILHQMGLGYTWEAGKSIYSTELCEFVAMTGDIKSYYLYWGLKFQFPFGFPKQKHYIDKGVAIQPIVLILEHILQLYYLTKDISKSYLTKEEIVKFLMRSKNHDNIVEQSKLIVANREKNYNYADEEQKTPGFNEAGDHFFTRGRLFIQNLNLIKFSSDKIIVEDDAHLKKIIRYLEFKKPPIVFKENSQDMRNQFFSLVYNHLDPDPSILSDLKGILPLQKIKRDTKPRIRETISPIISIEDINNPRDMKGSFTRSFVPARTFQARLRLDLLVLYEGKCCVCGLDVPSFLRTAHIVSVETDPSIAADRRNCLLLCVLHDVAFETGLIYLDDEYKMHINKKQVAQLRHPLLKLELLKRKNQRIFLPKKLKPNIEYIKRHRLLNEL